MWVKCVFVWYSQPLIAIFGKGEMFYLNSTLNFGIPPVLVLVDRLLTGLTAHQKGTTARYSNKTSLLSINDTGITQHSNTKNWNKLDYLY